MTRLILTGTTAIDTSVTKVTPSLRSAIQGVELIRYSLLGEYYRRSE
jgi:hypothetical protein